MSYFNCTCFRFWRQCVWIKLEPRKCRRTSLYVYGSSCCTFLVSCILFCRKFKRSRLRIWPYDGRRCKWQHASGLTKVENGTNCAKSWLMCATIINELLPLCVQNDEYERPSNSKCNYVLHKNITVLLSTSQFTCYVDMSSKRVWLTCVKTWWFDLILAFQTAPIQSSGLLFSCISGARWFKNQSFLVLSGKCIKIPWELDFWLRACKYGLSSDPEDSSLKHIGKCWLALCKSESFRRRWKHATF